MLVLCFTKVVGFLEVKQDGNISIEGDGGWRPLITRQEIVIRRKPLTIHTLVYHSIENSDRRE